MRNYLAHFEDLPRVLEGPFQISAILSTAKAEAPWHGIRGNCLEFCVRLSCADEFAEDLQNGIRTRMPYPHVYIKYPGSDYHTMPFSTRSAFAILYSGNVCEELLRLGFLLDTPAWPITLTNSLEHLMREIDSLCDSMTQPGIIDCIDARGICFLRELMLQHPANKEKMNAQPRESPYQNKILQIAAYIRLHLLKEIDLDRIIQANGLSRRSFFRYWNMTYPFSPLEYIQELRIREACRLLHNTSLSISDIAYRVGIHNSSYFAALFKRFCGMTPREFRKNPDSLPPETEEGWFMSLQKH